MRLLTYLLLPVLLVVAMSASAQAAQPQHDPPPTRSGWTVDGAQLVWTAPGRVPVGDAAVEFWDGTRLLGRPVPSTDHRTFTLTGASVTDPRDLSVRAGGRRLDAEEPRPPLRSAPTAPPTALPAGAVDPGTPGPYATTSGEYTLDPIRLPDYPNAVEMQGLVVAPVGAPGNRPLALFLHGRHQTCWDPAQPDNVTLEWPCPDGMKAIPSHRGYVQAQELLASQGYVTVSISANGINGQDAFLLDAGAQGRSSLVRQHLARWADWAGGHRGSAPDIVKSVPAADLSKVLLVGHSRGGEGVNRAATDSITEPPVDTGYDGRVRWQIRGTLLIGPTIFGHNPAPDVPSMTILPGCDGDVADLQGQMYLDATRGISRGTALHSALYVVGANHNFFNTEWTPGQSEAPSFDDVFPEDDPVCSPGTPTRLTAAQQQNVGATYIAAAARLFVAGDRRVLPLVDGSGVRAPSADPARVLSHAVGGGRTPFVVPDATTTASEGARMCRQVTEDMVSACTDQSPWWQPHFVTLQGVFEDPDRFSVALTDGGVIRPAAPVSLAGSRDLALRVIVPPNTTGNRFDVAITDAGGRTAHLGAVSLDGLPASEFIASLWAQEVRVPLPQQGIDLSEVASLRLTGGGQAWLVDAYGSRPGLPDPHPVELPRIDVGGLTVEEGDSGTRSYEIPVSVTGHRPVTMRLFVADEAGNMTSRLVTVRPGQPEITFPYEVTGNTRWSTGDNHIVMAKALRGAVSGRYVGGLTVLEDDPEPTVTITPAAGPVEEGGTLTWTATSSAVADDALVKYGWLLPPAEGQELSSTDVDPDWFRANSYSEEPEPSRPLSTTSVQVLLAMEPGELTAATSIPTIADTEPEPDEHVLLHLMTWPPTSPDVEVTGTVTGSS